MCAQKKKHQQRVPAKEFGVKMKMGVKDRLIVPQIFPKEANLISQRIMRDIAQKTELSQEEMDAVGMKPAEEGGVRWDDDLEEKAGKKTIKFTDAEIGFLKDQVKKLDETQKVTRDTFLFCERIHNLKGKEEREEKEQEKGKEDARS